MIKKCFKWCKEERKKKVNWEFISFFLFSLLLSIHTKKSEMQIVITKLSMNRINQTKEYVLTKSEQTKAISISISINYISFINGKKFGSSHLDFVRKSGNLSKSNLSKSTEESKSEITLRIQHFKSSRISKLLAHKSIKSYAHKKRKMVWRKKKNSSHLTWISLNMHPASQIVYDL